MKNKKNLVLLIIFTGLMIIGIQSCKKYADGPAFTLRTKTQRLSEKWEVDNYKINGSDFTSLVSGYTETFSKNGDYSYSWGILNGSGNWSFQNKDKEIKLNGSDGQSSRTLTILKLEEKSFWYYYMDGNNRYEYHMASN